MAQLTKIVINGLGELPRESAYAILDRIRVQLGTPETTTYYPAVYTELSDREVRLRAQVIEAGATTPTPIQQELARLERDLWWSRPLFRGQPLTYMHGVFIAGGSVLTLAAGIFVWRAARSRRKKGRR